ncbi:AraC-like ligand binding domain-containing protein [Allopseudospirillum japonicum]|uniref:AraC-like ligand binding domain-containing protein n=1 Tax=Allopseudospirillum japonicum TaxID=64971 RepID=A0A1H6T7G3_9GAMM|nr:AraC family transcriptional regulator [Allopseudospirillum japonicum]SEI75206.1 AraC-like ligand binding domain-containing protein [Allopseudospirillum japonicum]
MSHPSDWPLPQGSVRFVMPKFIRDELKTHPLTASLYPVSFGYYQQALGHRMCRDCPDDWLLIYCTGGEAQARVAETLLKVQAGDVLILPKGVAHEYQTSEATPWTLYWVHFEGELASLLFDSLSYESERPYRCLSVGISARLMSEFASLLEARNTGYRRHALLHTASQMRQLLSYITLVLPVQTPHRRQGLDLASIQAHMQANLHTRLEVDTLAEQANLSKYHFIHRYKALTGLAPIQHFLQMKIEHACHLLDQTSLSISEISYALGYEDSYYFSRLFKKVMGLAPTAYRRIRRG